MPKAGELDWSDVEEGKPRRDPRTEAFLKSMGIDADAKVKGANKGQASPEQLLKELKKMVEGLKKDAQQATDEQLFGHLVVSEEELAKKQKDWEETINNFYKEANKPIDNEVQDFGRGRILDRDDC